MVNLEVAVSSFWQLARHWKSGEKAKLELACEGGNLHLQLSAVLGHPDHIHFPAPSPAPSCSPLPASCKRKSPSQIRRQERRRKEALASADKSVLPEASPKLPENEVFKEAVEVTVNSNENMSPKKTVQNSEIFNCDQCGHTASCKANLMKHIDEKHTDIKTQDIEAIPSNVPFHCDQCDFVGASDKGLKQHTRIKHRISQVDGNVSELDDCSEEIEIDCFKVLARTLKCVVSCGQVFTTKEDCYKHMYISSSQCCQKLYSNLIECGLENEIKEGGIQKVSLKMFKQVNNAKKLH